MPSLPLLVLVNDRARDADGTQDAVSYLRELGLDVVTASPGDAAQANAAIRSHSGSISGVVVGGGDGSVSAVLPAVLELGIPLGILPMGTANDFARTLGLPDDLQAACRVVAGAKTRVVDVADVNGHLFVNNAAIGLPCEMAADVSSGAKNTLGPLASLSLLHRIANYARPFRAHLFHDGRDRVVTLNAILVGNGRYDGGFPIKYEVVDDGLLNVAISTARTPWETAHAVLSAWLPWLPAHPRLERFDTADLRIETGVPHKISADGDVVSQTPATFAIHREALTIFVNESRPIGK